MWLDTSKHKRNYLRRPRPRARVRPRVACSGNARNAAENPRLRVTAECIPVACALALASGNPRANARRCSALDTNGRNRAMRLS